MTRRLAFLAAAFVAVLAMPVEAQKVADQQSRREALALYRTGQELMSSERFDKAVEAFSAAVAKDSLLTVAYYGLGQAYMNLQRFPSAIKAYKDCIEAMRSLHDLQQTNQFDADKQRERAILQLHDHALQRLLGLFHRHFEQAQHDGLVLAEHFARRDAEQDGVADLAGGAGDGDANGFLAHANSPKVWTRARAGRCDRLVSLSQTPRRGGFTLGRVGA